MFPEFKKSRVDNIRQWRDFILSDIKLEMKRRGEYEPKVYAYHEERREGVVMFVAEFMRSGREKDVLSRILTIYSNVSKPDGIIFASEAHMYMARGTKADTDDVSKEAFKYGRIEDHPDNIEVVMVNYEDRAKSIGYVYQVLRDKKGRFVRLEKMPSSGKTEISGRFAQFIKGKPELEQN